MSDQKRFGDVPVDVVANLLRVFHRDVAKFCKAVDDMGSHVDAFELQCLDFAAAVRRMEQATKPSDGEE